MASGGKIEITDGHKCPVCLGEYDQPRVLPCNHVFCKGCLEQWLNKNKLQCPVCREETIFEDKFGVGKLPEPMINKDETEKLTKFLSIGSGGGMINKTCGTCKKPDASCYFCRICLKNLCEECQRKHKLNRLSTTHELIALSKLTLCSQHPDELITYYCCDCCQGLCMICANASHLNDNVIAIDDGKLVKGKKEQLKRFTGNLPSGVRKLEEHKVQVLQSKRSLADTYDKCEVGLISVREEVVQNIDEQIVKLKEGKSADLKRLAIYEEEIENMIATRNSLATFIKGLRDTAAEIVLSADNLPDISSNTVPVMPHFMVPALNDKVDELIHCAKSLITQTSCSGVTGYSSSLERSEARVKVETVDDRDIDIELGKPPKEAHTHSPSVLSSPATPPYEGIPDLHKPAARTKAFARSARHRAMESSTSSIVRSTPVPQSSYKHKSDFSVGSQMWDITYDSKEEGWWVRTEMPELLNLGLDGKLNTKMTKDIPNNIARICIDTKRDQLILVDEEQGLVCLSRRGNLIRHIKIPDGGRFSGVTYCPNRDVFVVTDYGKHCLWFVSSESGKVLHKLGSKGSGNKEFNRPYFICHQNLGEAECNIVVSDHLNHCIKLFTCTGEFIRRFDAEGTGDRQLKYPRGVCVDPWGRIIVCDEDNFRVVCFWLDGAEKFEVLLNREQLGGKQPMSVSVSDDGKLVGVQGVEGTIKIFSI